MQIDYNELKWFAGDVCYISLFEAASLFDVYTLRLFNDGYCAYQNIPLFFGSSEENPSEYSIEMVAGIGPHVFVMLGSSAYGEHFMAKPYPGEDVYREVKSFLDSFVEMVMGKDKVDHFYFCVKEFNELLKTSADATLFGRTLDDADALETDFDAEDIVDSLLGDYIDGKIEEWDMMDLLFGKNGYGYSLEEIKARCAPYLYEFCLKNGYRQEVYPDA